MNDIGSAHVYANAKAVTRPRAIILEQLIKLQLKIHHF